MNRPIKSPIQARMGSPLFLVKLASDLLKVHKDFLGKVEEFIGESKALKAERARILELPPGPKGDKGDMPSRAEIIATILPLIPAPIKGDRPSDRELSALIESLLPPPLEPKQLDPIKVAEIAASFITQPKDGESPALDTIVEAVIDELKLDDRFKKVNNEIASYRNQLAGKQYGKNTWARGGGGSSTSGGKSVATQYLLTAVQSGDDVTIDLTQLTNWATFDVLICLYRNNIPQTIPNNFSKSGSTLTVLNADAADIWNLTYSFS